MNIKENTGFVCTATGGVPLFGWDWLQLTQLNWQSVKAMQLSSTVCSITPQQKLNLLLQRTAQEGIGAVKQMKVHLAVDEKVTPKFLSGPSSDQEKWWDKAVW